jgi:uncharacterized protein YyaL (SSP411 family)
MAWQLSIQQRVKNQYLEQAKRAAQWIIDNRSITGGGFKHDETDPAGPYLGDTMSMGRAFLGLYVVTGERQWLARAEEAANFIEENFKGQAGYATAKLQQNVAQNLLPRPQRDENLVMSRIANQLFHYTGKSAYKQMSEHAMRYLATPQIAKRLPTAGVLLAEMEISNEPAHITIIGRKTDPQALLLFKQH